MSRCKVFGHKWHVPTWPIIGARPWCLRCGKQGGAW